MVQNPVEPPITDYLHRKAAALGMPLDGTFELTPCCNMACRMCYVRLTEKEQRAIQPLIPAEEWIRLAKEAKAQGLLYLLLTGGEPFLRKDIRYIVEELHKLGLVLTMNSNATLIDEEVVAWLKDCAPSRINITLYGASDETYARLCGNPKGFTQVTKAIRLLKEAHINVKINCSVTSYNVEDLEAIFDYCKQEELIIQATSYMFPPIRKDETRVGENDRFTAEDAAYYMAKIRSLELGEDAFCKIIETTGKMEPPPMDDCQEIEGEGIRCRAGKCCFWVTWNGKLMPCGMFPSSTGVNVFELGFTQAWEDVHEQALAIRLPAQCNACSAKHECRACAAMVVTESGDFSKVPEYRCQMSQQYYGQCMKLKAEIEAKGRN